MNYTVFQWFNNFAGSSKLLDTLMITITNSAACVAILFMLILWFNNGKKENAIRKQYTVLYTTLSVSIALLVNVLIHAVYYHPRPFVSHDVHQLVPHAADSSFVSDHSVLVFSIAFVFMLRGEKLKYIALIWAVLVGISRLYVGVHFPLDVIGAAVITIITSSLLLQNKRIFEPIAKLVFKIYALVARRIPFLAKYNHIA
ncbi:MULTISPECIES: undecaprenyl-diphosphatase [Bacillus cereus group]|uniref:undecaprenyl-diphosphatase n=1 Tax=Bacillus cereus group TaxID=86661 RepID=UPI000BEB5329|nr:MULTISPECIES: undecaprenyl-diphosphatase [Bacillus cereus group]MBJ7932276.1 undecaprenyl-diphosphatase [Bacillus cereus group sp. N31]PEG17780.1 undecaprenyl-diphosphatase [Bacillus toyonensis]PEK06965.1 undecaprenyl-diphosphatase [Bacillus toyonensis]PEK35460.1 undecaprenyl-diphosphatase [Bacillus toyonensis]PEL48359.1 undecaprenyl-diphosphatase [Bacillus toyonensis]